MTISVKHDEQCLRPACYGEPVVCFTRSAEEAVRWALLEREDDDGKGAILVFDRSRLSQKYKIDLVNVIEGHEEHEERVWRRSVQLSDGLIGLISEPHGAAIHKSKQFGLNRHEKWLLRQEANELHDLLQ